MQVANNARALEKHLEQRYEAAIRAVARTAKEQADAIKQSYAQTAKQVEAEILTHAKDQASMQRTQDIAAAKSQARKDEEHALTTLASEVIELYVNHYMSMSESEKNAFMQSIREAITQEIAKRNLNAEEFEFTEDINSLSMHAETDEILIEDGLVQRLEAQMNTIIEHIKEVVKND